MNNEVSADVGASATDWKHMYFIAITKKSPQEIDIPQSMMSGLMSMINAESAVITGAGIKPEYLINKKGTTVWLAMHALISVNNAKALEEVAKSTGYLFVPTSFLNDTFRDHINWPKDMIQSYDLEIENYNMISIPFIIPKSSNQLKKFDQSLKAPDGSLEVFGFREFYEDNPEMLLKEYSHIIKFIKAERPDITKN